LAELLIIAAIIIIIIILKEDGEEGKIQLLRVFHFCRSLIHVDKSEPFNKYFC
jgi:hypothetical protein